MSSTLGSRVSREAAVDAVLERAFGGEHTPYEWMARAVARSATSVLDISCGTGALVRRLVADGRRVTALTTSSSLADEVARLDGVTVVEGQAGSLPFEDESFDAVVTVFGAWSGDEQSRILSEVARVLRPGGVFAALLPSLRPLTASDMALSSRLAGFLRVTPQLPGPAEFKARKALGAVGLTKVEDARARYHVSVKDRADAELVIRGLRQAPDRARALNAVDFLAARAASGPVAVPLPVRRVVAIK